jgi:hypothetical protein
LGCDALALASLALGDRKLELMLTLGLDLESVGLAQGAERI